MGYEKLIAAPVGESLSYWSTPEPPLAMRTPAAQARRIRAIAEMVEKRVMEVDGG